MNYKYQSLMNEKGITIPCPSKNCSEQNLGVVYRWGLEPLENELNFLPNFLYNQRKPNGRPIRFLAEEQIKNCDNCSLSMYTTKAASTKSWIGLGHWIRTLLGYTHILEGNIEEKHGVVTKERPHFELFEYEGIELRADFKVLMPLSVE